jgi:MFS family permease
MAVVGGPFCSPVVGTAIIQSSLDWRWVSYLTGTVMLAIFLLDAILLDEGSASILTRKAARLRQELVTGLFIRSTKR